VTARHRAATALAAVGLSVTATAAAEPLGKSAAQYIVTSDARLDYQRASTDEDGAPTRTDYAFRLAGDYTLRRRLSVGGLFGFEGTITDDDSTKSFLIGGRVGYLAPIGAFTSWWPRLGMSFVNTSGLDELQRSYTVRTFRLNVSAPVVFQPYSQILVGVGPTYDRDLTAKTGPEEAAPKTTAIGVHLLFGLWFY